MNNRKKKGKQQKGKGQRSLQVNWRCQGNISCKDWHDKDSNGKNLSEAEEINKRWQEYTELQQKGNNDSHNHNDMITH